MSGCSLENTHATRTDRCPACGNNPQALSILQRDLDAANSAKLPLTAAQKALCYAETEQLSPLSGTVYYELCGYPEHMHGEGRQFRHAFVPWQGSEYQKRVGDRRDGRDPKHNRRSTDNTSQSKDAATAERDALAERLHHEALSTGKGTCPPSWSGHWRDWYRLRADEILAQRTQQAQDDAEALAQFIAGWCEQHPGYEYNQLADAIVARSKA